MKRLFLLLPAALTLSACAQPAMLAAAGGCNREAWNRDPGSAFYDINAGLPVYGDVHAYDLYAGRLAMNNGNSDCPRAHENPAPHHTDINKLGGTPDGGIRGASSQARPCSRA